MNYGVTSKSGERYLAEKYQKNTAAGRSMGMSFWELAAAKAAGKRAEQADVQNTSKVNGYQEYLKQKYGNVLVQNVGKDQNSIDRIGAGTVGTGNVIIAPNILEQMANDPEKAAYYEGKILHYFNSVPRFEAELSAMGHEIHSSGIVIHPDGTVTHYISGDLKPEVRAKIEARIKAEDEEKAKRRRRYQQLSQEAAEEQRQQIELSYKQRSMMELLAGHMADTRRITYMYMPEAMGSAIAVFEKNIMEAAGIL